MSFVPYVYDVKWATVSAHTMNWQEPITKQGRSVSERLEEVRGLDEAKAKYDSIDE